MRWCFVYPAYMSHSPCGSEYDAPSVHEWEHGTSERLSVLPQATQLRGSGGRGHPDPESLTPKPIVFLIHPLPLCTWDLIQFVLSMSLLNGGCRSDISNGVVSSRRSHWFQQCFIIGYLSPQFPHPFPVLRQVINNLTNRLLQHARENELWFHLFSIFLCFTKEVYLFIHLLTYGER